MNKTSNELKYDFTGALPNLFKVCLVTDSDFAGGYHRTCLLSTIWAWIASTVNAMTWPCRAIATPQILLTTGIKNTECYLNSSNVRVAKSASILHQSSNPHNTCYTRLN